VHADRCIGGARPAGDEAHARPPGELAVRLGHEGRAALLPVHDEARAIAVRMKAVEHREEAFARHAECDLHALRDQALDDQVACGL
jgi:hypothetical protein